MKLKTNKLLTLTLASSLVAITAGCGGSKTPAATGGGDNNTGGGTADTVAYSDWTSGATQAADLDDNAFLAGNTAGTGLTLVPTTTPATVVETLTLNSTVTAATTTQGATKGLSPVTLGGAAADGVAFFTVPGTAPATDARYFAGLLANTDLGGPITATIASTNATWNGLFQAIGDAAHTTAATSFTLNVNFADNEISAHIEAAGAGDVFAAGNNSYYLEGTFVTATGLITGNIIFGGYAAADAGASLALAVAALETATAADATGAATNGRGTVTGLIGAQGVLGAFHSNGADGDGALGFAGGFVATTAANAGGIDPDAIYTKWSGSDDVTIATTLDDNGFLAGTAAGLTGSPNGATVVTLDLADQTHPRVEPQVGTAGAEARTLGGVATNGVAFFTNPGATPATDARYFAGLHLGTDLGAPVATTGQEATWNGLIQVVSGTTASAFTPKVFELTVNFGTSDDDRTISAHVAAAADFTTTSYYLSGTYDANGVITGTVSSGVIAADETADATANGTLSGLIGVTGAVGAFHSTGTTGDGATGYAGGFVAIPTAIAAGTVIAATPAPVAEYADLTVTAPADLTTANAFLPSTTPDVLTFTQPSPTVTPTVLSLPSGTAGGVSFFTTGASGSERYFAGIHFDTSLGAPFPLTADTTATWDGMFAAVGDTDHATTAKSVTDLLTVTFGASPTIQGSVPAGTETSITVGTTAVYHINAIYDAAGVISGTVLYEADATSGGLATAGTYASTAGFGRVSGLIGASGAVGAFHSDNAIDGLGALGYAGGFYATP